MKPLARRIKQQERCPGCPFGGPRVLGRGDEESLIVQVGESPGSQEANEGLPFVGSSGKLLWSVAPENAEELAYTTNALKCKPRAKKQPEKMVQATQCCHDRLMREVTQHPRRIILAMGNSALWSLTGNYNYKITQARGKLIRSELAEVGILPTVHPAALFRGTGSYRQFREDVKYAWEIWKHGEDAVRAPIEPYYIVCDTHEKVERGIALLKSKSDPILAADIETSGLNRRRHRILAIGVAVHERLVLVFPGDWIRRLNKFMRDKRFRWTWHNGKFDVAFLRTKGVTFARVDEDTLLQSYALDENRAVHDLETVSTDVLGAHDYKGMLDPYLKHKKKKDRSYADVPRPVLYKYLAIDVSMTLQIHQTYRERVREDPALEKLYQHTLIPASDFLISVERSGICVHTEQLKENEKHFTGYQDEDGNIVQGVLDRVEDEMKEIVGYSFNPRSPDQVKKILYDKYRFKSKHMDTSKSTLESLPQHPFVKSLLEYRYKHKRYSTYIKPLWEHMQDDGRVHSTYLIHGTPTGRLASREPNMQNIPRDDEIRAMFCASPGYILLEIDLDAAELRSLAALSGDEFLCDIYNSESRSLHDEMAYRIFGENYTKEQRVLAKTVNFGIVYGREASSIAESFNMSIGEAQAIIDQWFREAAGAARFIKMCRDAVRKGQTMVTAFGRKKRFGVVSMDNLKDLQNEAANFPHQSTASDITLHSGIRTNRRLRQLDARIVNLVHDSLLIECPDNEDTIVQVHQMVEREMRQVPRDFGITRVPFTSDMKKGYQWGYAK